MKKETAFWLASREGFPYVCTLLRTLNVMVGEHNTVTPVEVAYELLQQGVKKLFLRKQMRGSGFLCDKNKKGRLILATDEVLLCSEKR